MFGMAEILPCISGGNPQINMAEARTAMPYSSEAAAIVLRTTIR
jgi:hypothetical protein